MFALRAGWRWPADKYIGVRVDSSEVGALENQRSGGPSGCMVDSAGTVRPLRAPTPLIAWGL